MQLNFEAVLAFWLGVSALASTFVYMFLLYPCVRVLPKRFRTKVLEWFTSIVLAISGNVILRAIDFEITGDQVNAHESALVICNHQTVLDLIVIQALAKETKSRANCWYNLQGRCTPFPDLITLVNTYWREVNRLVPAKKLSVRFEGMQKSLRRRPQWVVYFPEGDSYSVQRNYAHQIVCKASGAKPLKNVLYPRLAPTAQIIQYLRTSAVTAVYDITIRYVQTANPESSQTPSILDILMSNKDWAVQVKISRIAVTDIPKGRSKLERWIEKRWYVKDKGLQKFTR